MSHVVARNVVLLLRRGPTSLTRCGLSTGWSYVIWKSIWIRGCEVQHADVVVARAPAARCGFNCVRSAVSPITDLSTSSHDCGENHAPVPFLERVPGLWTGEHVVLVLVRDRPLAAGNSTNLRKNMRRSENVLVTAPCRPFAPEAASPPAVCACHGKVHGDAANESGASRRLTAWPTLTCCRVVARLPASPRGLRGEATL